MSEVTRSPCARCGAPVPAEVAYCPDCGSPVEGEAGSAGDEGEGARETDHADAVPGERESPSEAVVATMSGVVLDWDPDFVALVSEAASVKGVTPSELIRGIVTGEVQRIVAKQRGLMPLLAAAELLGVTKREVVQKINAGELRARKVDGEWMVDRGSIGESEKKAGDAAAQLELDLRELVATAGLQGLDLDAPFSEAISATLCYVNQEGVLVCSREAWRRLGRNQFLAEAKDAVRRYLRRRDRELGRL